MLYIIKTNVKEILMSDIVFSPSLFSACGLTKKFIDEIAKETGFYKRSPRKINLLDLVEHLCGESVKGTVSYNDLAARIQPVTGVIVSRQACWERIHEDGCVAFFKSLLAMIMLLKLHPQELEKLKSYSMFKRILIQDSTIIQLPARLFEAFSGVKNAHATTCNARIQGVYDLCSGRFISFSIDPYSKNDVSVASDVQTQPGDLILRDRGYFLMETIGEFKKNGSDTISRYTAAHK